MIIHCSWRLSTPGAFKISGFSFDLQVRVCRYTTSNTQSAGGFILWEVLFEDPTWVTRSTDGFMFTISKVVPAIFLLKH